MFGYLLLGLLLLGGLILIAQWFRQAEPARIARAVRWLGGAVLIALGLYLAVTGRLAGALAAATAVALTALRWHEIWIRAKGLFGPSAGNKSTVETAMLRMTLDHDSADVAGEVISGRYKGRHLSALSFAQLLDLLDECATDDPQSVPVLEAFLDRRFGPDWRERGPGAEKAGAAGRGRMPMTREEAYEILGLEPGADAAEIKAAHHRLMMKIHPDQGGSTYLAAKINQARDMLLGE